MLHPIRLVATGTAAAVVAAAGVAFADTATAAPGRCQPPQVAKVQIDRLYAIKMDCSRAKKLAVELIQSPPKINGYACSYRKEGQAHHFQCLEGTAVNLPPDRPGFDLVFRKFG